MTKYYFDTSIWLDFIENRDEPNFPKGKYAKELVDKIIKNNSTLLYSDVNLLELNLLGYQEYDILNSLGRIILFVESTNKQIGKAKDLSAKRKIPKRDALHALIARDHKAVLVSFDNHFKKITDIIKPRRSIDLI